MTHVRPSRSFGNLLHKHREFGLGQRTGLMAASRESERNDPTADLDQVSHLRAYVLDIGNQFNIIYRPLQR